MAFVHARVLPRLELMTDTKNTSLAYRGRGGGERGNMMDDLPPYFA